jgi:hypothetical protein
VGRYMSTFIRHEPIRRNSGRAPQGSVHAAGCRPGADTAVSDWGRRVLFMQRRKAGACQHPCGSGVHAAVGHVPWNEQAALSCAPSKAAKTRACQHCTLQSNPQKMTQHFTCLLVMLPRLRSRSDRTANITSSTLPCSTFGAWGESPGAWGETETGAACRAMAGRGGIGSPMACRCMAQRCIITA